MILLRDQKFSAAIAILSLSFQIHLFPAHPPPEEELHESYPTRMRSDSENAINAFY